jgi:aminocarboxymuconate-semialdehyde decarboxylase
MAHARLHSPTQSAFLTDDYLDTVILTYRQPAYLIGVFGPNRIVLGNDDPFNMAEYNSIGHAAEITLAQTTGGNAARVLGLDL